MRSLSAILALFSLLLFAKSIESRKVVEEHWKSMMKEQPIPHAIEGLLADISTSSTPKRKADCHESDRIVKKLSVEVDEEFEPRPNVSSYADHEIKAERSSQPKQPFGDDFEPRPNVSSYADHEIKAERSSQPKQPFGDDFEPRPSTTSYNE